MQRKHVIRTLLVLIPVGFILTTCVVAAFAFQMPRWYFEDVQCVFATNYYTQVVADTSSDYLMEFGILFYRDQVPDTTWRHPDGWWCTRR